MKKSILISFLFLVFCLLSSCRVPHEVVWDIMVAPFSGMDKDQVHNIDKLMPNCDHAQFELDVKYSDSLRNNENYWLYYHNFKRSTYSPMQTRMYDSTGRYSGSYELCVGNAKYLEIYKSVPISYDRIIKKRHKNIPESSEEFIQAKESMQKEFNQNISFAKDLNFMMMNAKERDKLLSSVGDYDYNIVVLWPSYERYYTKRHLRQIKRYVRHFGDDYSFRVIYVHLPSSKK